MCGKTCLKSTNLLFVALFLLISFVEIICGTYILVNMYKIISPEAPGQYHITIPSLFLILFGIILLHLIVLGCCGLCKEVACCVITYSSVLLILSVLQILMGVFAITVFLQISTDTMNQMQEDFTYSFKNNYNAKFVNTIQNEMHCCGVQSPAEWLKLGGLPSSCCGDREYNCHVNSTFLFENGCVEVVTDYIALWNSIIGYVSLVIGIVEILVAILGFSLGCGSFRNYYKV